MKALLVLTALCFLTGTLAQQGPVSDLAIADTDPPEDRQLTCSRAASGTGPGDSIGWYFTASSGGGLVPIWVNGDAETSDPTLWAADLTNDVATLTIEAVTGTVGTYECRVADQGTPTTGFDTAEVVIVDGPVCSVNPTQARDTFEVIFRCETTRVEPPTGVPTFDLVPADNTVAGGVSTTEDNSPTFAGIETYASAPQEVFDNAHTCTVTYTTPTTLNPATRTCQATVTERTEEDDPTVPDTDYAVTDQATQVIPCARGLETDNVEWTFLAHDAAGDPPVPIYSDTDDTVILDPEGPYTVAGGPLDAALTIDSLAVALAGTYTCIVTDTALNQVDSGSSEVIMTGGPPTCTLGAESAAIGEDVNLVCTVTILSHDGEQPEIQWRYTTAAGEPPEDIVTTPSSDEDDYVGTASETSTDVVQRTYECVVTNPNTQLTSGCTLVGSTLQLEGVTEPESGSFREASGMQMLYCGVPDTATTVQWWFTPFNDAAGEKQIPNTDDGEVWTENATDDLLSELHISTVTMLEEPVTAGSYRCVIILNEETIYDESVVISAYDGPVCSFEEPEGEQPNYFCDVTSSSQNVEWTVLEWRQGDTVVEGGEPADNSGNSDVITERLTYDPAVGTDTEGVTFTCVAAVGEDQETCEETVGGAAHVQLSVGVMLAALLLSALRIF